MAKTGQPSSSYFVKGITTLYFLLQLGADAHLNEVAHGFVVDR